ncbi:hypothetical protein [Microbacterium sp. R86528]
MSSPDKGSNKPSSARIILWIVAGSVGLYMVGSGVVGLISNGG